MARRPRVRPEAEAEILAAAVWYESKRPGLGVDFIAMVDGAFEQLVDAPEASPIWRTGHAFRKHVLRRFPFVVFYEVTSDGIDVVAVAHAKRSPGYWLDR